MILIVGGTSRIGRALSDRARAAGLAFQATSRDPSSACFLNLVSPPELWRIPANVESAILCASITGLDACERDPSGTFAVNVTATIALARKLSSEGSRVSFLSSSQVFAPNGITPSEDDTPGPVTEYGRQKLEVERYLLDSVAGSKIIRLTKVIFAGLPIFSQWTARFAQNQTAVAYADLYFSPIALEQTAAGILEIASSAHAGIFHLSASDSISYLDAAIWMAARLGANPALIESRPCPAPNSPHSCRLNCDRATNLFGYRLSSSTDHLQASLA
ncbi:MAG: SDR family oxidoreductase [Terrimicrobiaceae bacterium]|jgi:dTDP-4-dehydrorhamnose reductase